jgi:hypothetical protein
MRHRASILSCVLAVSAALAVPAAAQMNPRGEAKATVAGKSIVVKYGRPSLKGRDMLGKAAVGDEWRMGADAATTLETPVSLVFGETRVAPGEYVLRAKKVSDKEWMLKLQKDGQTAAEVPLQASSLDSSVEMFTIDLAQEQGKVVFRMSWGTTALATRFTAG